jgi:hypothetical protein
MIKIIALANFITFFEPIVGSSFKIKFLWETKKRWENNPPQN